MDKKEKKAKKIDESIEKERKAIDSSKEFNEKMEHQNNLLQLKLADPSLRYRSEIYLDIKYFIQYYIKSLDGRKNNYDEIQLDKIYYYFDRVTLVERIKLSHFLIRQIKLFGYDELFDNCEFKLKKYEIEHCVRSFQLSNLFKIVYLVTTYNLLSIFISFTLIYIFSIIFLLPAPYWSVALVKIEYHNYSNDFFLNHLLNLAGGPFEISDDFKVTPLSVGGFFYVL